MSTLASLLDRAVSEALSGSKAFAGLGASHPELPILEKPPIEMLRESLQETLIKVKASIARQVAAYVTQDVIHSVECYIDKSEPCAEFVADRKFGKPSDGDAEYQKVIAELWQPFMDWLHAEGLSLHIAWTSQPYGVSRYVRLDVDSCTPR